MMRMLGLNLKADLYKKGEGSRAHFDCCPFEGIGGDSHSFICRSGSAVTEIDSGGVCIS